MTGEIDMDKARCLQKPHDSGKVTWFITPVKHSNAFMVVVDGYRRKTDKECAFTTEAKPEEILQTSKIKNQCGRTTPFSLTLLVCLFLFITETHCNFFLTPFCRSKIIHVPILFVA